MSVETTNITGREPRLSLSHTKRGQRRLSLRGLATALNALPPEAVSLPVIAEALRSDAFYVRYSAAKMLARRGDRDARMIIHEALTNGSAPTRASATRHLYGFSWFSAEPLLRQALGDSDQRVRAAAISALSDLRELNAFRLMVEALRDETDDNVRMAAAIGLRDCQDVEAVPVLESALGAEDPAVRVKTLEALGANGTPQAIPATRSALDDLDSEVVYAATLSLVELAGETCLDELSAIIGQPGDVMKRREVMRGLFNATCYLKLDVGTGKAADDLLEALESALHDESPEIRIGATWPLGWMQHTRADAILRTAYHGESDSEVKEHILRIAISFARDVDEAMQQDALNSPDVRVRETAERAQLPEYA
jgi:HEAT repeat protein